MSNARELAELGGSYGSGGFVGMKNRIINGAMVIDQRNAGASAANAGGTGTFFIDRWGGYNSDGSKYTVQQNAGSVTPPANFRNYMGVTSSSAFSIGAASQFQLGQGVEGYNMADFNWGTASAQSVTASFWVRSSLTGTFVLSIRNDGTPSYRSYVATYTINSANTWEQKTIIIPGDTGGPWNTTNGAGMYFVFTLGAGSNFTTSTTNSWVAGNYINATGATNLVATNGATFYVTGVQLEKGTQATSFDYRPYGTELALCQRYYFRINGNGVTKMLGQAVSISGTQSYITMPLPVEMRAYPTLSQSLCVVSDLNTYDLTISAINNQQNTKTTGGALVTHGATATIYRPQMMYIANASAYIDYSAEL